MQVMNSKQSGRVFFVLFLLSSLIGLTFFQCTSAKMGEEVIESKSQDSTPEWLFNTPKDTDDKIFFVGRKSQVYKLDLGITQAKAQAMAEIAKKISTRVRAEFVETATGTNVNADSLSEYLDNTVAFVADNVRVSAVSDDEIYWERVKVLTPEGLKYHFNIYTLLSIPKHEYEKAKRLAAQKLMENNNEDAQKVAKEVMGRLLEESEKK